MTRCFEGIYPPVIVSFTENGDIYEKEIRNVISYLMSEGVNGLFHRRLFRQCNPDDH
jgi:dihydrodipicolinate synthase/N-acetylneuraminate lyase